MGVPWLLRTTATVHSTVALRPFSALRTVRWFW
jgi:hypothetical protein